MPEREAVTRELEWRDVITPVGRYGPSPTGHPPRCARATQVQHGRPAGRRPYRKNDSCHVEQKNWAVVRQSVGYARYDTDSEVAALSDLYRHLRLLTNFFQPQAKLIAKSRDGAKVRRVYDQPITPYQRV